MVPREKLDQAYLELDHALRREQRAQQLLKEQSEQLNELGSKVDFHTSAEMQKDATLTDAVQVCIFTIQNQITCTLGPTYNEQFDAQNVLEVAECALLLTFLTL